MSSYTSLSDHCNSIQSSRSVIHSELLLNVNVYRNFGLKTSGCHGDLEAFITHSSKLRSFFVSTFFIKSSKLYSLYGKPWSLTAPLTPEAELKLFLRMRTKIAKTPRKCIPIEESSPNYRKSRLPGANGGVRFSTGSWNITDSAHAQ